MILAVVLLGLAAVCGVMLTLQRLSGEPLPSFRVALAHGVTAMSGLVALALFVANGDANRAVKGGLVAFLLTAGRGFVLFSEHLRRRALPIGMIVMHVLVAIAGFLTLLVSAFQ